MSELYIKELDDNGNRQWGLFYEDKGEKHLTESFKPVSFDTEEAAKRKLEAMSAERARENDAVAFTPEEAIEFANSLKWKFATTYAKTAPHEYIVKKWLSEDDQLKFERLVQAINKYSVVGYFYEHKNNYLILDDHYYWYMPFYPDNMAVDLINRTTTDYLEYRDGAYYYKEKQANEDKPEESKIEFHRNPETGIVEAWKEGKKTGDVHTMGDRYR